MLVTVSLGRLLTVLPSYQNLAFEARKMWLDWNDAIANSAPDQLPPGVAQDDKLLLNCGCYYVAEGKEMRAYYADSLASIARTAPDFRKRQFVKVRQLPPSL